MTDDPWHCPRPELAKRVLAALTRGSSTALTLFAPRRTGKTEFLLKDLDPLARRRRVRIVHFATPLDLPSLDLPFVDHLLATGKRHTGRHIDRDEAIAAFEALHRNPYFFRLLIEALLLEPDLDVTSAQARVRARLEEDLHYPETWLSLDPLQRALVHLLVDEVEKPFGRAARARMALLAGVDEPIASRVQTALRKLSRLGIADSYTGRWSVEDPAFADWVRAHGQH